METKLTRSDVNNAVVMVDPKVVSLAVVVAELLPKFPKGRR